MLGHSTPLATTVRRTCLGRPGKRGTSGGGRVSGHALSENPLFTLHCRQFRAKPAGGAPGGRAASTACVGPQSLPCAAPLSHCLVPNLEHGQNHCRRRTG